VGAEGFERGAGGEAVTLGGVEAAGRGEDRMGLEGEGGGSRLRDGAVRRWRRYPKQNAIEAVAGVESLANLYVAKTDSMPSMTRRGRAVLSSERSKS
jgi:hypothetical protein